MENDYGSSSGEVNRHTASVQSESVLEGEIHPLKSVSGMIHSPTLENREETYFPLSAIKTPPVA
jgi:hypothetical protein